MGWLDGYSALVTGGGSGLGAGIVAGFIAEGARVAVLEKMPDRAAALREQFGDGVVVVEGDVRSIEDNERAVAAAVGAFGALDVFVANAGIFDSFARIDMVPAEKLAELFEEVFAVNVKGYLLGSKAAIPELRKSRGSIIFTLSTQSFAPSPAGGPVYVASKHALLGLMRQLAAELAPDIRVNAVAPGPIKGSDIRGTAAIGTENQSASDMFPQMEEMTAAMMPMQLFAEPSDYAASYVLLASREKSRATTGSVLLVDSGGLLGSRPPA